MGLTLPSELTEPLGWVGLTWPQADEELLFEAGQRWLSYGEELTRVAERAEATAAGVWQGAEGPAAEAFEDWWTRGEGPRRRLAEGAAAALLIGGALIAFAALTLALKINFIVQLIVLAVEVAQAIATAFVTFGVTTAEIPGFIAVTRFLLRRLVQQVVSHITTVLKDIFVKAKSLLKKAGSRLGGQVPREVGHPGLFSRAGRLTNREVVDSGAGLPRTREIVEHYTRLSGADFRGWPVDVIEGADDVAYLDFQGAVARTDAFGVQLGPSAFQDEETLVRTLGHESVHVRQYADGRVTTQTGPLEDEAYAAEDGFVARWRRNTR